jgi:spermidine synthase
LTLPCHTERVEYVEIARAESERGEIVLRRRIEERTAEALELRVNGVFVMDTRETTTETALATAALDLVEHPRRVVVAGLGLGFTAQQVLADHRVELVKVVEIEQALIDWMRDGTIPHGRALLADKRLHVVDADIRTAVAEAMSTYDLVLLDVDNGPRHLVYQGNAPLYERTFIAEVARALRPGGALVVWSADESADLADTMESVFGDITAISYDVTLLHPSGRVRDERYWLYLSRVPERPR